MNKKYSIISAAIVILIALDQITKHLFQNALLITRTPFLQSKEIKVIEKESKKLVQSDYKRASSIA